MSCTKQKKSYFGAVPTEQCLSVSALHSGRARCVFHGFSPDEFEEFIKAWRLAEPFLFPSFFTDRTPCNGNSVKTKKSARYFSGLKAVSFCRFRRSF